MAKSIIGQALKGHPNWAGAAKSRAASGPSIISQALAGHPNWGGPPASRAAATGTFPQSPSGAASSAPAAPPAAPSPTVQPFLTPDQQRGLDDWNTKYGDTLGRLTQSDADAQARWTADTGAENLHFAQNNNLTNQSEAARGLFQSSIRMNALSDLAVTHAAAINTINTNRDTALSNDQTSRQDLGGENSAEQNYYAGLAVTNAQGVTPVTGDNAGVSTTSAATTAAPAPPAQHNQPSVAAAGGALQHGAAALEQPRNTGVAAAGSSLSAMHGAALQRVHQPTAKPPGKVTLNIGPWQGAGGRVGAPR